MANNPITIGPFANVPAPGSPIRSDWAQQITTFVNDRFPNSLLMRQGHGTYGTNANGDALVGFSPPFPTSVAGVVAMDATGGIDNAFIVKLMSFNPTTAVIRVYLHDGTKVLSNGMVTLSWVAFGR